MQELAQSALSLLIRDRTPVMELYLQLFDTQLLRQRQAEADYRKIGAMLNELREFVDPFQVTLSSTRAPHRTRLMVCRPSITVRPSTSTASAGTSE